MTGYPYYCKEDGITRLSDRVAESRTFKILAIATVVMLSPKLAHAADGVVKSGFSDHQIKDALICAAKSPFAKASYCLLAGAYIHATYDQMKNGDVKGTTVAATQAATMLCLAYVSMKNSN